jgi:pyruvate ferredoxin oxidoreductase beta subunit
VNVVGLAGDGATIDIGFQGLSAAAERGESFLHICCDNEAYMNTGTQKSGSTPFGAWTATTPLGARKGKRSHRKDLPLMMALHKIPYVATASIAYIPDLIKKVEKASKVVKDGKGLAYLHIHAPCPVGWRFPEAETVKVARLAVQTGCWIVYEIEEGNFKINLVPKRKPVSDYLKIQGRFRGLSGSEIAGIQEKVDKTWESIPSLKTYLELTADAL